PLTSIRDAFVMKKERGSKQERKAKYLMKDMNEITIMSNFGYQVLVDIILNKVPPMMEGKSLVESKIKDYFSINIMMVSRGDETINITKDTVIAQGDRVIAFGPYESIHTVFGI
ncbi:MAG: TrkA C-terminal domain-containing protein, partial [Spirochaetales bacterium]|nr:TrkA C-terminal domain-containing protein [Spirochaetales bacterium]